MTKPKKKYKGKKRGKKPLPKHLILKARGVRFNDDEWKRLNKEARNSKVHGSPSEIVRALVQKHYRIKNK